jgi:hypothetical protein
MSKRIDPDAGIRSLFYRRGEAIFAGVALPALDRGWTLIPQERRGKRRSAIIDGRLLRWGAYIETPPTRREMERWCLLQPSANGAILLGKASGNVFCLDMDVLDEKLVYEIIWLADEIFGRTPFSRIGQAPKHALFYRMATGEELPANLSWRFTNAAGDGPSEDLLEIQARGKLVTAYGYHHKTERYFSWEGAQPTTDHVDTVTLVTMAQVEEFIERVQQIRPFHHKTGTGIAKANWNAVDVGGVRVPRLRSSAAYAGWVVDAGTGLVVDGREGFLWHLASSIARMNAELARTDEGVALLRAALVEQFTAAAEMSGKWTERHLRDEATDKMGRAAREVRDGRIAEYRTRNPLGLPRQDAPANERRFLAIAKARTQVTAEFEPIADDERAARQLNLDRDAAGEKMQAAIVAALTKATDAVYAGRNDEVHVIPGATGAGKTTRTIRFLAEDPRTKSDDALPPDSPDRLGPWVFLLPTYNNVSELKANADLLDLDPTLDDEGLMAQAAERGLVLAGSKQVEAARRFAADAGLRVEVYKGKLAAGCAMEEVVAPLMKAGVRTGQMCKSRKRNAEGQTETVYCAHYKGCPAILQRERMKSAHLVIMVQNFLTLPMPEELKKVRGVVLDERTFHLVLHGTTLKLRTLEKVGRRPPRLNAKEIEAGVTAAELIEGRNLAARIAAGALREGKDVAQVFRDDTDGRQLVAFAKRVCGSSLSSDQAVYPNMTAQAAAELLRQPAGVEIAAERRFWRVIEDRMDLLDRGEVTGETDRRIQYLHHVDQEEQIAISWRDDMNWSDRVRILLDASVDPAITVRIFPGTKIVMESIHADLNLRMLLAADQNWAISGLVPREKTTPADMLTMAKRVDSIRSFIARLAGIYAHGVVLVGMPKAVREAVQSDWLAPYNVDFGHHGAMRGLDFADRHVASVVIGRLEPPVEAIDKQVGALTYRDPVPEKPIDALGTGLDDHGREIGQIRVPRRVRLRDRDAIISTTEYAGELARRLQSQYREEENRQFVGRVRPVWRQDTPDAIVIGQSLPQDMIVDALTTFDAMQSDLVFWDLVRRNGGVIDVEAMAKRSPTRASVAETQELFENLADREEVLRRYHCITSTAADGSQHQWFVPGYFSDDEMEVLAYTRAYRSNDEILAVAMCPMATIPSGRAPIDEITEACGDPQQQMAAEAAALKPIVELLVKRGEWRTGADATLFRAGEGELEREQASLGAWAILARWVRQRAEKKAAAAMATAAGAVATKAA